MPDLMTDEEYRKREETTCPNKECGSTDITGGSIEIGANAVLQGITCNECWAEWVNVYHLSHYQGFEGCLKKEK